VLSVGSVLSLIPYSVACSSASLLQRSVMNSLSSISYSLEGFGPLRDWCVLGSYRGPLNASDWQLRLKLNWSRYRLSYLSLWALTTWYVVFFSHLPIRNPLTDSTVARMINAPSVYGSFFWLLAFVVCFIVRHPLLTQPKKITIMCLGAHPQILSRRVSLSF
jgi:hypothetical protein